MVNTQSTMYTPFGPVLSPEYINVRISELIHLLIHAQWGKVERIYNYGAYNMRYSHKSLLNSSGIPNLEG